MNKKIVKSFIIVLLIATVSCKKSDSNNIQKIENIESKSNSVQQNLENAKLTEMTFDEVEHDFGTINAGDKVDCVFTFTNTGDNDLIITNAQGSCGCTVPEYPKEPTKPGEKGEIKVSFNSKGKSGEQTKTVTLAVNTENRKEVLKIKASIKPE